MNRLVAIVGPTGIGKTELAVSLARVFSAEIVNADSRQVYRYMDIGTAKPNPEQRAQVPHHILDVVNPDEDFSLALYQEMACKAIEDIRQQGKLPLLVGGSGLYVWSVVERWDVPRVVPDKDLRQALEARAQNEGHLCLFEELQKLDPEAARRIDPRNVRRVIRALEVCLKSGHPFSELQRKNSPPYPVLIIGLTIERAQLYRRVDSRIDSMVERGWVAEVEGLLDKGYRFDLPSMSAVGYKDIGGYIQGKYSLAEAIQKAKFATHRFIRHQYAWFRPSDGRIRRLEIGESVMEKARALVNQFIKN